MSGIYSLLKGKLAWLKSLLTQTYIKETDLPAKAYFVAVYVI